MNTPSICEHSAQCMHDPRCPDLLCEGHPVRSCSSCNGGPCPTPEACWLPVGVELQPIRRRLFARRSLSPQRLAAAIGALAACGALWYGYSALARYAPF